VTCLITFNSYFTFRESMQVLTMRRIGLLGAYFMDAWNTIDFVSSALTFVTAFATFSGGEVTLTEGFRNLAAATSIFVWLKFLGKIQFFDKRLATFVYSLSQIIIDSKEFMVVFMVLVFMFAHVFFILLGPKAFGDDYDGTARVGPFGSGYEAVVTSSLMSMGVFSRDWFLDEDNEEKSHVMEFYLFVFLFVIFIIMLNVLIAVVSDSYDYASTQAETLFLVSRFELVAELDALGLTEPGILPERVEAMLKCIIMPLARSLQIVKRERSEEEEEGEEEEEEEEAYEGRIKYMEDQIRGIVQEELRAVKTEIIFAIKESAKNTLKKKAGRSSLPDLLRKRSDTHQKKTGN